MKGLPFLVVTGPIRLPLKSQWRRFSRLPRRIPVVMASKTSNLSFGHVDDWQATNSRSISSRESAL
jgi:hypothetical protein